MRKYSAFEGESNSSCIVSIVLCITSFCVSICLLQAFFKENVRYPIWIFRDPIFSDTRDPMIIFSDYRDLILNSRGPNRVPKTP